MRGRVGQPKMKTQEIEHFGSTFMPDCGGIRKCLTLQLCVFPSKLAVISWPPNSHVSAKPFKLSAFRHGC